MSRYIHNLSPRAAFAGSFEGLYRAHRIVWDTERKRFAYQLTAIGFDWMRTHQDVLYVIYAFERNTDHSGLAEMLQSYLGTVTRLESVTEDVLEELQAWAREYADRYIKQPDCERECRRVSARNAGAVSPGHWLVTA